MTSDDGFLLLSTTVGKDIFSKINMKNSPTVDRRPIYLQSANITAVA